MEGLSVFCVEMNVSVVHVLFECPAYKDKREGFMAKLRTILGEAFKDFEALDNIHKASFVLGCELWTENFNAQLALVKEYIMDLWEVRKVKLENHALPSFSLSPRLEIRGMALWWGAEKW